MRCAFAMLPLLSGLAVIGTIALSGDAGAYCRAVSKLPPAGWNIATQGCFGGDVAGTKDLYWAKTCVGYSLHRGASRQVTLDTATALMASAFANWNEAACADGGKASIQAVDLGPVDCAEARFNPKNANQNVIVFRDDVWPNSDPNNTLGLTTITFDTATGEILGADMEINATQKLRVPNLRQQDHLSYPNQAEQDGYDLATVLIHEVGHFLGLAHTAETGAVMYARYQEGVKLADDDKAGLCAANSSDGRRATSAGTIVAGGCDPTPPNGFAGECAAPPVDASDDEPSKGGCSVSGMSPARGVAHGYFGAAAFFGLAAWRRGGRGERRISPVRAALATMLAALLVGFETRAGVSIAVLFDELIERTSVVAVVTPTEQHAVWENGRIVTYTELRVDRFLAGNGPRHARVRTLGGNLGRIGQVVEGEAMLDVEQPALVFLQRAKNAPSDTFEVTARAQGIFALSTARQEPLRLIQPAHVGALVLPLAVRRDARYAAQVLSGRTVDEAARDIIAAWPRLHSSGSP